MRKYSQDCPIARTLDVIGDRWTILIVRDMFLGHTKFGELRERSSIPPKVLSARLKLLMEHGVIERRIYSEHPLRAEYHLTERGRELLPVILSIGKWGFDHLFEGEEQLASHIAGFIAERIPDARESLEEGGYVARSA
jgi:DNA-binding HxlR family transcriptional regulator